MIGHLGLLGAERTRCRVLQDMLLSAIGRPALVKNHEPQEKITFARHLNLLDLLGSKDG
jgi:hypothetical protein